MLQSYKELEVWKRSMELVREICVLTEQFPADEKYGLRSQMQRAVVGIPSSIAEGYLRNHRKEYVQFLSISLGSAGELETQLLVCKMLSKFSALDFTKAEQLLKEVLKMLTALIAKLEK